MPDDGETQTMTGYERAVQVWQVLIAAATSRQTLTYRLLGERVGLRSNQLAPPLNLVARYCMLKQFPPLTVLVVQAGDGKPGKSFTWATEPDLAREAVFEQPWFRLRPPSSGDFQLLDRIGIGEPAA
jgi:hypothetical protein